MEFFEQLGALTEQRWRHKNYDEAVFDAVALEVFEAMPPAAHVSYDELMAWALTTERLPPQDLESDFGQPPLTVYSGHGLYIEALFWLDATTNIHQHGFSGAFHVLAGSSIQSHYEFETKERINARLYLGDLRFKRAEYLRTGDSRPIAPGARFIHSAFHLDYPSVTIVLRTLTNLEAQPQLSYLKPGVAYVKEHRDEVLTRQLELLNVLRRSQDDSYLPLLTALIAKADAETAFRILDHVCSDLDRSDFLQVLDTAATAHGPLLQALRPVLVEKRRQTTLIKRRQAITDPDHRFFFAMLLNLPNRHSVFEFMRECYDTDPVEQIMAWIEALAAPQAGAGAAPGGLDFRFEGLSLEVVRGLLEGLAFPAIWERLKAQHDPATIAPQEKQLQTLYTALRKSALPLFID